MESPFWESEEEFIGEMLTSGAMERAYHENGELFFDWNDEKLIALYPEVYRVLLDSQIEETLSGLVDQGLVEMGVEVQPDGQIEAVYSLSDEGRRVAESMFGQVTDEGLDIPDEE